ncbi:NAD-dependent epimerase/dehydratase family protein [Frigoribacterium sp. VKM Ac-2530]|uniref:NAD-dependent epimerase/dehydratase family protein n=1 Tax=Frigoribacterium sp. VKM Ac-2530 TaxID=2783822 RepID=UPI00188BA067|nr:NAD-dependent epimerase/dehydratase family protein [Frigoribacterium sp. VKM Ac-2530]
MTDAGTGSTSVPGSRPGVDCVVVGSRGLLGAAVVRAVDASHDFSLVGTPRVRWGSPSDATSDLAEVARSLGARTAPWALFWCAGAGVNGMDRETADHEVGRFEEFLAEIRRAPSAAPGVVFLASSAGGVFAGASGAPFGETSPVAPLSEYGRTKLRLEGALRVLADVPSVTSVVGRFANIYGPGQDLDKQQGLISHLCRSTLQRRPISIFVPLDTLRDYVYVDDAARASLALVREHRASGARAELRVVASGTATTVATVITAVAAVAGAKPLIVLGTSPLTSMQGHDLRLRPSTGAADEAGRTPLGIGIAATWRDMFARFVVHGRS